MSGPDQPIVQDLAQQVPLPDEPDEEGEVALPGETRDAVVVVSWTGPGVTGVVEGVTVAGRPTHPYQGEGNHVTAWAVFADTVRRAIVGRTLAQAVAEMQGLLDTVGDENEWALLTRTVRRARFVDAVQRGRAALVAAVAQGAATPRVNLRNAIASYLSARNYAPLASGYLGVAQAIGGGERAALRVLRRHESASAAATADQLRDALWVLLDKRTLGFALGAADATTLPGVRLDDRTETFHQMIVRHLEEVSKAYPRAYRTANLTPARLAPLVAAVQFVGVDTPAAPPAESIPASAAVAAAPADWSLESATGAAVDITLTAGPAVRIGSMTVASRGKTLLGGQGHHLTAHIALEAQLRRAVVNKQLPAALADLVALCDAMMALHTFPGDVGGQRIVPHNGDPKGIFDSAWADFTVTLATARALVAQGQAAGAAATADIIPELASAYLCVRNALPLVAINRGGPATVDREPQAVAELDAFNATPRAADAPRICGAFWQLLSAGSVGTLVTTPDLTTMAPGFQAAGSVGRLRRVIEIHRAVIRGAWPAAYAVSNWTTAGSLTYLLDRADIELSSQEFIQLRDLLGFTALPHIAPNFDLPTGKEDDSARWDVSAKLAKEAEELIDRDNPRRNPSRSARGRSDERTKRWRNDEEEDARKRARGKDRDEEGYSSGDEEMNTTK